MNIDSLRNTVANSFREVNPIADIYTINIHLDKAIEAIEKVEEEDEYCGYLKELQRVFEFSNCNTIPKHTALNYINHSLDWGNFYDGEGNPYSLGSMFYNKLTWIKEGSSVNEAIDFCEKTCDCIIPLLDEFERIVNE